MNDELNRKQATRATNSRVENCRLACVLLIGFAMPGLCLAQVAKRVTFPDPSFVETNGIKMAVYEQGDGFPVVFCHGFPELAYSWRHQLPALAEAGYHAIAPDQRGYGRTDRPDEIEAYSLEHLCNDMVGLLDAKNIEKAVFCGHDWGGLVVWMMPILHPDRVAGVIGVNTPLTPRPPIPPIQILRLMREGQLCGGVSTARRGGSDTCYGRSQDV